MNVSNGKYSKLQDGAFYTIRVNCICEGEWLNEISEPFLTQFHRVMGNFVDAEGNTSQSPIEWFEDVRLHAHYSCGVLSAKLATNANPSTEKEKI